MIQPKGKLFGLIGHPAGHSMSPALHRELMNHLGFEGAYQAFDVPPEQLEDAVTALETLGYTGFNVTVPHKQAIMKLLDEHTSAAQVIGAVNTVIFKKGSRVGANTDSSGFMRALRANGVTVRDKTAVVLGAGGAARAVIFSLIENGIGGIRILNRTVSRAKELVEETLAKTDFARFMTTELSAKAVANALPVADLFINATSVGMWPDVEKSPCDIKGDASHVCAIDLVYNPVETRFLKTAREAGAKVVQGIDMLIFQGIEAMQLWTDGQIDAAALFEDIKSELINEMETHGRD